HPPPTSLSLHDALPISTLLGDARAGDEKSRAGDEKSRAGDSAQALMDLGASICTPKKPACALCPLNDDCAARERGDQETFPRKLDRKSTRLNSSHVAIS